MSREDMETAKLTINIFVDKKENRILYAEAGKDFVDFLFGLLTLPLGSVISLLTKKSMVGCIGNLYESVENLSSTYLQPNRDKDTLLKPNTYSGAGDLPLLPPNKIRNFYSCPNHHSNVTDYRGAECPDNNYHCRPTKIMDLQINYVARVPSSEVGYVKDVVKYMVMDNLVVMPMSTSSSFNLLKMFNIENVNSIEEKEVDVTIKEGLEILRASLGSSTVLSDVFLVKKESTTRLQPVFKVNKRNIKFHR